MEAFARLMSNHIIGLVSNENDADSGSYLAMVSDLKEPPILPSNVSFELATLPLV